MSLAQRDVRPEILDDLAPDDPRAERSRADLRRVNALMFQARLAAGLLRRHCRQPPRRLLEIGGGDGAFSLSVARKLARQWPGVEVVLLDRADLVRPRTIDAFQRLGWHLTPVIADICDWLDEERGARETVDCVCANLFLHHFPDAALVRLFRALRQTAPLLVATEPRRSRLALAGSSLLWAVGANDVTRHDAPASVRAGFAGDELGKLWAQIGGTPVEERAAGLFSHVFAGRSTP